MGKVKGEPGIPPRRTFGSGQGSEQQGAKALKSKGQRHRGTKAQSEKT